MEARDEKTLSNQDDGVAVVLEELVAGYSLAAGVTVTGATVSNLENGSAILNIATRVHPIVGRVWALRVG